ncbi:hypothetical protein Q6346_15260 [Isoptericola sp. b490]|uniref:hypothetical protein n=1 Tax=Actinotalea lenta TaxID=3064654 RepID=UPI00271404F8|nr:hypothetical protein [Isoptericola sp. b490]MDO8122666.1 hypothetical protein [Isoptericola sp. b490]
MCWPTAGTVDAAAGQGWPGLWSVLFTAERAVMALVQATSFAEGLDLIWLAEDLTDACEDIRVRHPGEVSDATAADLGPLPADGDLDSARQTVAHLIASAIRRIDELSVVTTDPSALLWLAGSGTSLFAARTRLVTAGVR